MPRMLEMFSKTAALCAAAAAAGAAGPAAAAPSEGGQAPVPAGYDAVFLPGTPNPYNKYFTGQSYLQPIIKDGVPTFNVTFEPGCRNFWHIHNARKGGGQILLAVAGRGWYQEEGKPARELKKGDAVYIAPGVKHWHGAARDSWFTHIAMEVPGEGGSTTWCEPVSDEEYGKLP